MRHRAAYIASLTVVLMAVAVLLATGPLAVAGRNLSLAEQVTIRRDTYGVPHILAETEEAAAFAMGYAQAEDHCVEIAHRFIGARGEEAKYTGAGAENDFRMKRYGNYEVAKKNFDKLGPLFQKMMNAYAEGFNLYVEKHRKELPNWIPKFDGVDVLARGRAEVMRFAFSEGMIRAVRSKYPENSKTGEIKSPIKQSEIKKDDSEPLEEMGIDESGPWGSNMWALAGSRTDSGNAMLMGNPHQAWAALYWEAHLTVPGKINFYGSTFVGRPLLTTGFNEHLGWSHTVNYPDLMDVYALTLDPKKPDHYIFDGKPMPLTKKEVAVEIKTSSGSLKTERREYWDSHLGPVIHRTTDKAFAAKSAILDAFRYYEEWYELSKSKKLNEFLANLKMNHIPMFNICYADADGNILYLWNGMVPKRVDDGMDYSLVVPGDSSKYVWTEFHKTDELPQLINPSGGYVQNCNDAPWYTSLRNFIDSKKYPSYFEPGRTLGLRTQMSLEMLEGQEKFSLDDVMWLKFNTKMLLADRVKPDLIKAIKHAKNPSEDLKRGLAIMEAWDNHVSAESKGGVLFQRFWDTYSAASKNPFAVAWDQKNPASTPHGLSDAALAAKHFEEAVRWTRKAFGSEDVAWGEAHRIRLGDLDLPANGAGGGYGLFHVMSFGQAADGKRVIGVSEKGKPMVGGGDGWIFAVEFSKPVKAYSLLTYGQTSNPASKHNSDQARLFAERKFKRALFSEADIKANLERSYHPGQEGER